MKLNYYGIEKGATGYGVHASGLLNALKNKGVILHKGGINMPTLAISMPEAWQLLIGDRPEPFIPFIVSEGDKICDLWRDMCNLPEVTALFTPSKHVKEACIKSGVKKDIIIAPHGINPHIFNPEVKKHPRVKGKKFKFFMLGGWGQGVFDRKGFQYALKAYDMAFSKDDNVELYWKINMTYNPSLNIKAEISKLGLSNDRPNIHVLPRQMDYEELPSLYKSMDCFIAPSMADAFNIPCLEAMSVGLPVISTSFGGMTDYVDESVGWLTPIKRMIDARGMPNVYYEGVKWGEPDVEALASHLRYAYEHGDECKSKGVVGVKRAKDYTWDKTASIVIETFKKYGVLN